MSLCFGNIILTLLQDIFPLNLHLHIFIYPVIQNYDVNHNKFQKDITEGHAVIWKGSEF